jgi:hypothetical protein
MKRLKEHTQTLLTRAEKDLVNAKLVFPNDPAGAASAAQQCAEKSVKAVAFELGDYIDADRFNAIAAKDWGHDSALVCMAILKARGERAWQVLGVEKVVAKNRKQRRGNPMADIAYIIGKNFIIAYEDAIKRLETSPFKVDGSYWMKSLDPKLKPSPVVVKSLAEGLGQDSEDMDMSMWAVFSMLGLSSESLETFDSRVENAKWSEAFEAIAAGLRARGLKKEAKTVTDQFSELEDAFGPGLGLVHWLKAVLPWLPYLDAHAKEAVARYADAKHAEVYESHREGVHNLIEKSSMIHEETVALLEAFETKT